MLLGYLTEEAYDRLINNINNNADKYLSGEDWLQEFFGNKNDYYKLSKTVEVGAFSPFYSTGNKTDAEKTQEDLVNTRTLHEAFIKLTPLQASNKYMWTYLCHAVPEFSEYIKNRWMTDARENTIRTRYFVTGADSLRNDNALSRLWWYGHLTYDKDNSNHYALTEILLMNQTVCTDILDTYNRMNFNRIKGVLLAVRDFKDDIGNEGITEYVRECNKYLNRYAAVTDLDFLEADEIRELAYSFMTKARENRNS